MAAGKPEVLRHLSLVPTRLLEFKRAEWEREFQSGLAGGTESGLSAVLLAVLVALHSALWAVCLATEGAALSARARARLIVWGETAYVVMAAACGALLMLRWRGGAAAAPPALEVASFATTPLHRATEESGHRHPSTSAEPPRYARPAGWRSHARRAAATERAVAALYLLCLAQPLILVLASGPWESLSQELITHFLVGFETVSLGSLFLLNHEVRLSAKTAVALGAVHVVSLGCVLGLKPGPPCAAAPACANTGGYVALLTCSSFVFFCLWKRLGWILHGRGLYLISVTEGAHERKNEVTTGVEIICQLLEEIRNVALGFTSASPGSLRQTDLFWSLNRKLNSCRSILNEGNIYAIRGGGKHLLFAKQYGVDLEYEDELSLLANPASPTPSGAYKPIPRTQLAAKHLPCSYLPAASVVDKFGKVWTLELFQLDEASHGNLLYELGTALIIPRLTPVPMDLIDEQAIYVNGSHSSLYGSSPSILCHNSAEVSPSMTSSLNNTGHAPPFAKRDIEFYQTLALRKLLFSIQIMYRRMPYHNSVHGSLVCHAFFYLLEKLNIRASWNLWSAHYDLACGLATLAHDIGHPGLSNKFFVNSYDPISVLYNDESVLENYHCCLLFIKLEENNAFFAYRSDIFRKSRELMIRMVLATDMKAHFEHIAKFRLKRESGGYQLQQAHGGAPHGVMRGRDATVFVSVSEEVRSQSTLSEGQEGLITLSSEDDLGLLLDVCIKAADLGASCCDWDVHLEWCHRIAEEFYRQGELEKSLGMVVSPMCDRASHAREFAKSQAGFINFIALPLFQELDNIGGDICDLIEQLRANEERWRAVHEDLVAIPTHIVELPQDRQCTQIFLQTYYQRWAQLVLGIAHHEQRATPQRAATLLRTRPPEKPSSDPSDAASATLSDDSWNISTADSFLC